MELYKITIFIKKIFTPCYLFTLDRSIERTSDGYWLFKEFGTHTFVKKRWNQLVEGDFLRHVNPKDIAHIAETESKLKIESSKYTILEEKRNCTWTLKNGINSISISGIEFVRNRDIVDKTDSLDATKIAFYTGIKEGRELSAQSKKQSLKIKSNKTKLTLIK